MKEINIIDPHQHFWDLSLNKHAWLIDEIEDYHIGDYQAIRQNYMPDDYKKDTTNFNVSKTVHVQVGWERADHFGETIWLEKLNEKYSLPNGIVAYADLSKDNVENILARQSSHKNVRGIRQILNWHEDPFYTGCDKDYLSLPEWQENFSLLKKYSLSFDLQIYPEQMDDVAELAKNNPDIQLIVNHAGMPRERNEEYLQYWKDQLKIIAACDNIAMKISGFGMFEPNCTEESIRPLVLSLIEIFGTNRCMFASNFPVEKLYLSFDELYQMYFNIVNDFKPNEIKQLFHDNAEQFYSL